MAEPSSLRVCQSIQGQFRAPHEGLKARHVDAFHLTQAAVRRGSVSLEFLRGLDRMRRIHKGAVQDSVVCLHA